MAQNFSAQVNEWVAATKERQLAVFRQSVQAVIEDMQTPVSDGGNLPFKTGFLRASLVASLTEPQIPVRANPNKSGSFEADMSAVTAIIASADLSDTIYAVYTAAYACRMEYGFEGADSLGRVYHQTGRGFVRLAVQRWPQIVANTAKQLKALNP